MHNLLPTIALLVITGTSGFAQSFGKGSRAPDASAIPEKNLFKKLSGIGLLSSEALLQKVLDNSK